jgi:Protein of unknown function (DUF3105)
VTRRAGARLAERLAIAVASLALAVGLIALLSGFFAGRDQANLSGAAAGPGEAFPDQGHGTLRPGQRRPRYDSIPPTSGAHMPEPVRNNEARINDDQILQALELGDVVIVYGSRDPPPGLLAVARTLAPRFSPALAAAGQAVILAHRPGHPGLDALSWAHLLRATGPTDPRLRQFVEYWLGRGAPAG